MSMHEYTHFGVYVECYNPIRLVPVVGRRCVNQACKRSIILDDAMFCSACGNPTQEYQTGTTKTVAVDVWEVSEAIDQDLWPPIGATENQGIDIWLPNKRGSDVEYRPDVDTNPVLDLASVDADRARHIATFEREFADALDGLRKAYGAENVKVEWGIISYAN